MSPAAIWGRAQVELDHPGVGTDLELGRRPNRGPTGDPTSPARHRALASSDVDHLTPEDEALQSELVVAVRDATAGLPPGQRAAVRLFYLEGLSEEEVAATLGTTPGAVKARLHKARSSLRPKLVARQEEVTMPGAVPAEPVMCASPTSAGGSAPTAPCVPT